VVIADDHPVDLCVASSGPVSVYAPHVLWRTFILVDSLFSGGSSLPLSRALTFAGRGSDTGKVNVFSVMSLRGIDILAIQSSRRCSSSGNRGQKRRKEYRKHEVHGRISTPARYICSAKLWYRGADDGRRCRMITTTLAFKVSR
jgi:hypothetical protein